MTRPELFRSMQPSRRRVIAAGVLTTGAAALAAPAAAAGYFNDVAESERQIAATPEALQDRAYWPQDDAFAPDYAHLDSSDAASEFELTADVLRLLFEANDFQPRPASLHYRDDDHILFALRGCRLAAGQAAGVLAPSVRLVTARPNLRDPLCTIGVWRRAGPRGILVVPGSTVPNADAVAAQHSDFRKAWEKSKVPVAQRTLDSSRSRTANLLPTGRYEFIVGLHGDYKDMRGFRHFRGAFRMAARSDNPRNDRVTVAVPVIRPGFDATIDLNSNWDVRSPSFDNLHPAVTPKFKPGAGPRPVRFSSEGCLTVAEYRSSPPGVFGEGEHWAALREACGTASTEIDARYLHSLCLLTGDEAALATQPNQVRRRLRFGSAGGAVPALQAALGVKATGMFDEATLLAWRVRQQAKWPRREGWRPYMIVSPRRATALELKIFGSGQEAMA